VVNLIQQIEEDLVRAMKAGDATAVSTLRLVKAAAKNAEVAKRAPLEESEYRDVVVRQSKLRREAAYEYERAGRQDRADQERAELAVLQRYMPEQLDEADIRAVLEQAIADTGASGPSDLGKVMARAMPALKGKADGAQVNRLTRELLAQRAG
jgi:uncharacterized protein